GELTSATPRPSGNGKRARLPDGRRTQRADLSVLLLLRRRFFRRPLRRVLALRLLQERHHSRRYLVLLVELRRPAVLLQRCLPLVQDNVGVRQQEVPPRLVAALSDRILQRLELLLVGVGIGIQRGDRVP